jgi:hypothetical protein
MKEAAAQKMGVRVTALPTCHLATLHEPADVAAMIDTMLPTCHMVILQEPAKVAAVIDEAARKVLRVGHR